MPHRAFSPFLRVAFAITLCALARAASTFNPGVALTLSSTAPGANADMTVTFSLQATQPDHLTIPA